MANLLSFGLKNFRNFKDKIELEFAPITILTGPNSSGKSSITKAILLLQENLTNCVLSDKLRFINTSKTLGNFDSVLNNNSESKQVEFYFTSHFYDYYDFLLPEGSQSKNIDNVSCKLVFERQLIKGPRFIFNNFGNFNFDKPARLKEVEIHGNNNLLLYSLKRIDSDSEEQEYEINLNVDIVLKNIEEFESELLFTYLDENNKNISLENFEFFKKLEYKALVENFTNCKTSAMRLDNYDDSLGLEDGEFHVSLKDLIYGGLELLGIEDLQIEASNLYVKLYKKIKKVYSLILENNPFCEIVYIPAERSTLERFYNSNQNNFLSRMINLIKQGD